MTPNAGYAAVMLLAGLGIPVLAALNAQLGTRLGSPVAAAFCLFIVALCATTLALLLTGPGKLATVAAQPKHLFLAGLLVAFYVLSITWVAPRFGVGNAIFFVLLGQLIASALIDQFGLFGARVDPLSAPRLAGLALMGSGLALTQFFR